MSKGPTARATGVAITTTVPTSIVTVIPPTARQDIQTPFVPVVPPNMTITGVFNITEGTGTTSLTVKLFNEQGTQIDATETETVATAGSPVNVPICFLDNTGVQTDAYTIQVTCNGATAGSTINLVNAYVQTDG